MNSMAAMGIICKGRSSSPPLLLFSRQAAAISLVFGIFPMVRNIPSEVNPSDGPSRGVAVGAAPETRAAHSDRLGRSLQEARSRRAAGRHRQRGALAGQCQGLLGLRRRLIIFLVFLMMSRVEAGRPPKQERHVRFEKRGPQAWEKFAAALCLSSAAARLG